MISVGNRTTPLLAKPASLSPCFLLPRDDAVKLLPQHRRRRLLLPLLFLSRSPRCSVPLPRAAGNRRGKSAAVNDSDSEDEDEEEEEGELLVPLANAREWLEKKKPRGFGAGKVYDTSLEDKLAEEIERSRRAQAANVAYLKANPNSSGPKKDQTKPKDIEVPNGFQVRVFNLPKKKNIDRDLKVAFQQVPGLVSIVPAVSGNKKTKDPICKGFAFVNFRTKEDAARFARQFSGEAIAFGKIQKPIKCQVMNSQLAKPASGNEDTVTGVPNLARRFDDGFVGSDFSFEITTFVEFDEDGDEEFDEEDDMFDDDFIEAEFKEVADVNESPSISKLNGDATMQPGTKNAASGSRSQKTEQDKNRAPEKKVTRKGKKPKLPKLDIPGSAKRLKVKDKAVLSGVFAKYSSQAALAAEPEPQR